MQVGGHGGTRRARSTTAMTACSPSRPIEKAIVRLLVGVDVVEGDEADAEHGPGQHQAGPELAAKPGAAGRRRRGRGEREKA